MKRLKWIFNADEYSLKIDESKSNPINNPIQSPITIWIGPFNGIRVK